MGILKVSRHGVKSEYPIKTDGWINATPELPAKNKRDLSLFFVAVDQYFLVVGGGAKS